MTKCCLNCQEYNKCKPILKRLGCKPDDPNNPAIKICSVFRPRPESEDIMKNTKPIYRHTCQVCQCFFESNSNARPDKLICPECGAIGRDGFIATEKLTLVNAALHSTYKKV